MWVINKSWYGKLSAEQKKVIDDHCTNEWAQKVGVDWGDDEDVGKGPLSKDGHTIVQLIVGAGWTPWKKAAAPVYDKWLADADKAGSTARRCWKTASRAEEAQRPAIAATRSPA